MWRELIRELDPAAELHDGATEADLKALEAALNVGSLKNCAAYCASRMAS